MKSTLSWGIKKKCKNRLFKKISNLILQKVFAVKYQGFDKFLWQFGRGCRSQSIQSTHYGRDSAILINSIPSHSCKNNKRISLEIAFSHQPQFIPRLGFLKHFYEPDTDTKCTDAKTMRWKWDATNEKVTWNIMKGFLQENN